MKGRHGVNLDVPVVVRHPSLSTFPFPFPFPLAPRPSPFVPRWDWIGDSATEIEMSQISFALDVSHFRNARVLHIQREGLVFDPGVFIVIDAANDVRFFPLFHMDSSAEDQWHRCQLPWVSCPLCSAIKSDFTCLLFSLSEELKRFCDDTYTYELHRQLTSCLTIIGALKKMFAFMGRY